jgi:hypothetical protein
MRSVNLEILWNRWDKLRAYDKVLVEVYSSVRRVIDAEATAMKALLSAYKLQADSIAKLSHDLKQKPFFRIVADSLDILKEISHRKAAKVKEDLDTLLEKVVTPLNSRLLANEESVAVIAQGEKNYQQWIELNRSVAEKWKKVFESGAKYDLVFETEHIKQQVKTPGIAPSKNSSSSVIKAYDKLREEDRNYRFAVETYNRHTPTLMNENVALTDAGRNPGQGRHLLYVSWQSLQRHAREVDRNQQESVHGGTVRGADQKERKDRSGP